MRTLTDADRAVLELEHEYRHRTHQAAKEQAARDRLGITAVRYYQILNRLLDDPAAEREYPMLVKRLRRLRAARRVA